MLTERYNEIPPHVRAVLGALSFSGQNRGPLEATTTDAWAETVQFCDSTGLTIPLYLRCGAYLPDPIRIQLEEKLKNNSERWSTLKKVYGEIAGALERSRLEFAVLKGFTQWPLFVEDPRCRPQYDIDLLLHPRDVVRAAAIAGSLGFEPGVTGGTQPVVDHFPTLVRKTGWVWRNDYFDPEIPFSLELHFRCWDRDTEGFGPTKLEETFWDRIVQRSCEELSFRALDPAHGVLYTCLHMLRHLLRGQLRPSHVYECAWFLHRSASDDEFWMGWDQLFTDELRDYQTVCFGLAREWFSPALHPKVESALRALPGSVHRWLHEYSHTPLAGLFQANKDELWLHWSLLGTWRQRMAVLRRRLLPGQLPGPVSGIHLKSDQLTWTRRARAQWDYLKYLSRRGRYHFDSLLPTSVGAAVWVGSSWRDRWANRS